MTAHLPPTPPANRSDKGAGDTTPSGKASGNSARPGKAPGNTHEQDRQGNTEQNTHHKGYQQDR